MRNTTNWQNHTCNKIDLLVILTHLKASWPSFITGSFCCFPPIIIKYIFLIRLIFWNTETAKTSLYRSVMHITSLIPLKKKERKKISKRLSTKTFFFFCSYMKETTGSVTVGVFCTSDTQPGSHYSNSEKSFIWVVQNDTMWAT